ncbi:MAG: response regulator [bacterium]|nr:response regulator [Candidatus Margulisiibacteriota bacterium]
MSTILIIEDEEDIVEAIAYNLRKEGFSLNKAYDGEAGLSLARRRLPDLIILDLMLPKLGGLELCKTLKKDPKTATIPIIMLTAKSSELDKVLGLELGADDYLTKPFSMRELIARIRTILNRYSLTMPQNKLILSFPDLEINIERHEVKVAGKLIALTAKEFALLQYLAENEGKVIGRTKLLDTVWGIEVAIETRTVDAHMRNLRDKLGRGGQYLKTVRGVGYKFSKL